MGKTQRRKKMRTRKYKGGVFPRLPTSDERRQTAKLLLLQRKRTKSRRLHPLVISKTPSPPKLAKMPEKIKKKIINSPLSNQQFIIEIPKPHYVVSTETKFYVIKNDKTREIFTKKKNKLQSTGQYYKNEW